MASSLSKQSTEPSIDGFDSSKSTKGASKLRRDLINAEISNLRDLLPLPPSTRQRLSQLQLMALVCVYVRKANYFQQEELNEKKEMEVYKMDEYDEEDEEEAFVSTYYNLFFPP
ncbi:hypothetical protein RUM44_012568 [Polyplax serrata]|uniref:BHLH domain-containing protein n=1 Tax=Polyplax serrata TaxID=468196 RepID=A0ABR1BDR5_POLSC